MERWRKRLIELERQHSFLDPERLLTIDTLFRKDFPGNYAIVEHYRLNSGRFIYEPIFEDDAEKTMWLLKYS